MATMETFVADKWVALDKGKDLFSKAADSGIPIRVVHPNGNFKVIRNGDKLPEAERFTTTFCDTCGSRLARFIEDYGMVFIPAGSLDDEPDMGPQARIFTGSRAAWSCDSAELTEFEEYPA